MSEWVATTLEWLRVHAGWIAGGSVLLALLFAVLMVFVVARMSPDYFVASEPAAESWRRHHPVARVVGRVVKNLLGAVLLGAGLAMLVLPGQGLLTILVGIGLLDLPGKRRLELWLVRRPQILESINWIREKAGRPPLIVPQS